MEANEQLRHNRVARLKKIIIFLVIFFLLLPLIICFILGIQIRDMRAQIDELSMLVNARSDGASQMVRTIEDVNVAGADGVENAGTEEVEEPQAATHKVYLTFDDGPSVNTNAILDVLKEYDVKATFFVVGKEDEESLEAYRRIVDEGHTLAIHSYSHKYGEIYSSVDGYAYDLERLTTLLYQTTGVQCRYVRFPGGSSNKVSNVSMSDVINYVHDQGMEYFDWNISASDAVNAALEPSVIVSNVMNNIDKYDTSIVLMHDTGSRKSTVLALPEIIEKIQALDGYELLPIDETTELVQHLKIEE